MTVQIQFRRGTSAEWAAVGNTIILASGEPGLDTTNHLVKYGDGISVWNSLPTAGDIALGDLTNVSAATPSTGQVLKWTGTQWAPGADAVGLIPTVLADLDDVSAATPSTDQVLAWNGVFWTPTTIASIGSGASALSIKGTVADSIALSAISGMVTGDAYVVSSPAPAHLWSYNSTSWVDLGEFQGPQGVPGIGIPTGGNAGQVLSKINGTNYNTQWVTPSGGGMSARSVVSVTTGSLAIGQDTTVDIPGFKGYALIKMVISQAAWIRVYVSNDARTADASRLEGTDPTSGSGVIAEVITNVPNQTVLISPGTIGFSNETTPTALIPIRITNKSGSITDITVTLTLLQLEA